jgi:hypothetical protein
MACAAASWFGIAGLALFLVLPGGCRYWEGQYGAAIAPDAPGWTEDLTIEKAPGSAEFVWRDGPVTIAIQNWGRYGSTYFQVDVWNSADLPVRMRVRRLSRDEYELDVPGSGERVPGPAEGQWIGIPARGGTALWLTGLAWADHPAAGDRIEADLDFEWRGGAVSCPLRFRVVRATWERY